eukprot:CAMPEP_0115132788 /NCGR_PEP_ID=MMETSP0227-20121206/53986_1 /TAXON_ID=89957 /ORGANISM="Polarella glacialis, Strain CCMP 1383" /LENGTH=91 /DNA_ID=CAMNT_0002538697 /DNA_START=42 /DNA_END=317 /DNA_ORIENTATION=+
MENTLGPHPLSLRKKMATLSPLSAATPWQTNHLKFRSVFHLAPMENTLGPDPASLEEDDNVVCSIYCKSLANEPSEIQLGISSSTDGKHLV